MSGDETKPLLDAVNTLHDMRSSSRDSRSQQREARSCDLLGVDMRNDIAENLAIPCGADRDSPGFSLGEKRQPWDDLRDSPSMRLRSPSVANPAASMRWTKKVKKDGHSKAYRAAAVTKLQYLKHGTLIQEFFEPEIEKRYQDWYDTEYKHGVLATFAASLIWVCFSLNWIIAFHDAGDTLWHVLIVHFTLSIWQLCDYLGIHVYKHPWYMEGVRWQNYILFYTTVFEVFIVLEFAIISSYTVEVFHSYSLIFPIVTHISYIHSYFL